MTWQPGRLKIRCSNVFPAQAKHAVVTLPLGVLQAGSVRFDPPPASTLEAAAGLRMGQAMRFTAIFNERLWPETMSFLLTPELTPSVWWTAHPMKSLSLTGWIGGPRSAALLGQSEEELRPAVIDIIASALSVPRLRIRKALASLHTHDWRADRLSCGAYTWVPTGGLETSSAMAEPVQRTLFFAGEHTDLTGHWGTVHAAYGSGLRAAAQVLALAGQDRF